MAWNVASFAFAVNGQQPDFVILFFEVVDNAHASTFPFSCHCPTKLSYTTGTRNKFSRFRILEQEALETEILVIGQVCVNVFGKSRRLNKFHNAIIRLCRINRKGQPFLAEKVYFVRLDRGI